jgi:hypothetical protein
MQPSFAFINSVAIEEVSLPLWRELFDAIGWPPSIEGAGESLTHESIMDALHRDPPSDELLLALETLDDLGTPVGRETITAQLNDRRIQPGVLPPDLGERELALRLFMAQRSDGALAEVFSRAQVQIQEGNSRRFNDFAGKQSGALRELRNKLQALEQGILDHCRAQDLGEHVQVRLLDGEDGTCRFQIMRSHHTRTPLAVMPGATARAKIQYRPVHADLVRYEPDIGRLRITARAASIVECYRKVFGRIFFGDEAFFGGRVCSLSILQKRGSAALTSHGVYSVGRVWMTECIWERGDRERLHIHAADCFDTIAKLGLSLNEGEIIQAKLKMEIVGKSSRPLTVTVRAPSRIEVTQVRHEALANEVLTAIGIRDAQIASPESNLWTLHPWRQPVEAWRACFGRDTDGLARAAILKKALLSSIEERGQVGAGRVLQAVRISNTEYLGVSQMEEIASRSLSATDLDGLELDVSRFQPYLRERLEMKGNFAPWTADAWHLDLGVLDLCGYQFRIIYAIRRPPDNAAAEVRAIFQSIAPVLLLPTGLDNSTGLAEVLLDGPLPELSRLRRDIVAVADLSGKVPALLLAPPNARLVVDSVFGQIWFDAVEITDLKPGTHAFRFVEILAKNSPGAINKHDLANQLSRAREDGDQGARSAKAAAIKKIRAAVEAQGRSFEDPFKSETGSFRLTVLAFAR